eukprot:scaffold131431_cov43-Cyclotella_meneghiniana.AAC.1
MAEAVRIRLDLLWHKRLLTMAYAIDQTYGQRRRWVYKIVRVDIHMKHLVACEEPPKAVCMQIPICLHALFAYSIGLCGEQKRGRLLRISMGQDEQS